MTPTQHENTCRFIRQLNRLSHGRPPIQEVLFLAEKAADPARTRRDQEAAMVKVAILIGEYNE